MSYFDDLKPRVQQEQEIISQQEYKFIGSIPLKKGMSLFKLDLTLMEYSKVVIREKIAVGLNGKPVKTHEASYHNNCIYFQALNLKNAKKHAMKELEKLIRRNIELTLKKKQERSKASCTKEDKK
jgi:hypothetical protein